jgi:hypothetical protein
MEVRVYGSFGGPVAEGREDDRWSHPALPGLRIGIGIQPTKSGPQMFVGVNTEDVGMPDDGESHEDGKPIMAVYLNDATLYDVEPPRDPELVDALAEFKAAACRLRNVWESERFDGDEVADYPKWMPSFEEAVMDLDKMEVRHRDEKPAPAGEAQTPFDPTPTLYETTLVVSHYATSDEAARQTAHSMGDLIFEREDVVKIEGSSGDETGRSWRTTTTERGS